MLLDQAGNRKYLTATEREAFIAAAAKAAPIVETFCLTLVYTGARISEVLAVTPGRIDYAERAVVLACLKKRRTGIYRAVPVPDTYLARLEEVHHLKELQADTTRRNLPLWHWSRTTAWYDVKSVMAEAGIAPELAKPKALRHAFGVGGTQAGVPLNVIQRWLGHSRMETTAIYTNVMGDEERALANRMWQRGAA